MNQTRPIVSRVTLYFDPACPWTWRTSRWLVGAAGERDVPVEYSALELTDGKPLEEIAADRRAGAEASRMFLRGVVAARRQNRHGLIGAWYTALGTARWDGGAAATAHLVRDTLAASGGSDLSAALADTALDQAMAASRREALELAGDDVGSPVTVWEIDGRRRGFFGPVVGARPAAEPSDSLWAAVVAAATVPEFFELKARRTLSPVQSPPTGGEPSDGGAGRDPGRTAP